MRGGGSFQVGAPANDLCQDAIELDVPDLVTGTTVGATFDEGLPAMCGTSVNTAGVWYRVTGVGGWMWVETCEPETGFDTKLSLFCGSCEDLNCVDGNNDATCGDTPLASFLGWCSVEGLDYWILVHGFSGETGPFGLRVYELGSECVPSTLCEPTGACCFPAGECLNGIAAEDCIAEGGTFRGLDSACEGELHGYTVGMGPDAFQDISSTGSLLLLDDDESQLVPIGFPFYFFGEPFLGVRVSSNGYLTTDGSGSEYYPEPCLDPDPPNGAIFALMHDFDPSVGGSVHYQTFGTYLQRVFVAQWTDVPEYLNPADRATFQVKLYECCGVIDVTYHELIGIPTDSSDATVAIEDASGLVGTCFPATTIAEGHTVRFQPHFLEPLRCGCLLLDFETEDDGFTPLVNGQDLSTPPEFGHLLRIDSSGAGNLGAAIFDSDPAGPNAAGLDPDLLVDLGNVLILQSDDYPQQSVSGIFDSANDSSGGGVLTIEFFEPAEPYSLDLIDLDYGHDDAVRILMYDVNGRLRAYWVPDGWTTDVASEGPPGYGTLDLTSITPQSGAHGQSTQCTSQPGFDPARVIGIEIYIHGSGAIDNLDFCVEPQDQE